jgi:hypothetical protein
VGIRSGSTKLNIFNVFKPEIFYVLENASMWSANKMFGGGGK